MTREEAIRLLSGLMFKGKLKEALDMAIKALEQEPTTKNDLGVDCISRDEVCRYVAEFVNHEFSTREEEELIDNIITGIEHLPSVTPQLSSGLEKNSKLEKIRDQLKSHLRGVEITLEVLVENDPLRPKMEGAKDTLEECLELIDKAESEDKEQE